MKKHICLTAEAIALSLAAPAYAEKSMVRHLPEIHHALRALENAKSDLIQARHDYGGHRARALEHIEAAQAELRQGLEFEEHMEREHHDHHDRYDHQYDHH